MMGNRKAAPVLQHQDGKVETGPASQAGPHLHIQSTTLGPAGQVVHIAVFLSYGPENGITLRHLEKLSDLPGREVRRQIERERRRGIPILSDNMSGYFLPSSEDEKARCVRSMKGRAREILRTAWAIEGAAGLD